MGAHKHPKTGGVAGDRHYPPKLSKTPENMRLESVEDISPQLSLFYKEVIDWSKAINLSRQALRAGDEAPSFLLPDENGRLVSSRELLEAGPLILGFFLGSWSPFCVAELKTLSVARPAFRSHGAELVAVSHETADLPRTLKRRHRLELTLLSDVDHGVGLSFGVVFSLPETLKSCLLKCGVDLPGRHGSASWILPIPATYVIDQSGIISAAFIYHDFTMRPDPGAIIEELTDNENTLGTDQLATSAGLNMHQKISTGILPE